MKKHLKTHLVNLSRYQTSLGRDLEGGIRLDRNERVSNLNPAILEAVFKQFNPWSLSASPESGSLYEKIAGFIGVKQEKLYITNGITEGVKFLFETLTKPGDNVIVLDPTYPMYLIYSKFYQTEYRKFDYFEKTLTPDWNSFYRALDQNTALVMLPNPNLPIESVFTLDELRKLANDCKNNGTILLIDEAYHYFGAPSALDLVDEFDNVIIARSFSKAFGLASIRLGFMVSNPENIAYVSKTRSLVEANTLSMAVAGYFLDHPSIMEEHVREVKEGSAYLQAELTKLGIRWHGGYVTNGILIFLDNKSETNEVLTFLRKKKIYIRGAFQAPYESCVRVSIGPKKLMELFVVAFKNWLEQTKVSY